MLTSTLISFFTKAKQTKQGPKQHKPWPIQKFMRSHQKVMRNSWEIHEKVMTNGQTVRDSTSSYKIDYVIVIKNSRNPKGHQNPISGSKVTAILLKQWILPIGGASLGRVCACSLRSRLVFKSSSPEFNQGQSHMDHVQTEAAVFTQGLP